MQQRKKGVAKMISTEEVDQCTEYLAGTDEQFARAKAYMNGLDKQEKTILSLNLLKSVRNTLGLRDAEARTSPDYCHWREKYVAAVYDYELVRNKRITSALVIELYRTELSARKTGMII